MKNLHQKKATQFALEDVIQGRVVPIFVVLHHTFLVCLPSPHLLGSAQFYSWLLNRGGVPKLPIIRGFIENLMASQNPKVP